jgi:hypothetical protein
MSRHRLLLASALVLSLSAATRAAEPLPARIDALIAGKADPKQVSPLADDAEFLRRVTLDFAGRIPTVQEVREFLKDPAPDKRTRKIDQLLNGPGYPRRMAEAFHVHLMERLGDNPEWLKYLEGSFAANKPWDVLAREILRARAKDEATRGAAFFTAKRLENYGQNPVDYAGLTRDVGRLFFGKDLRCCQCHDHLFIDDYKQADFQGLFAFYQNTYLADAKTMLVGEKPTTKKVGFMSVFKKQPKEVGPRMPGGKEIAIPQLKKGEEYIKPADPKKREPGELRFSPLERLAAELPTDAASPFTRNIVNRVWFLLLGRGLVHPLDLHHAGNPPSHPEVLDLLSAEFVAHHYDLKWLMRQIALTGAYQRSSRLPDGVTKPDPAKFLTAIEKRLSAEQLLSSVLEATGERPRLEKATAAPGAKTAPLETLRLQFVKAFAEQPREPEEEISPSLKAALFLLNDRAVLDLLIPRPGNLTDRLGKLTENGQAAEELYLSVLSRPPTAEEKAEVVAYLTKHAARRATVLGNLAWALLASTEFGVNH